MSSSTGPRAAAGTGAAPSHSHQAVQPAGVGPSAGSTHVHVFNRCSCGLAISPAAAAAQAGGDFQQQDAAVVSQINTAAFATKDITLLTQKRDREEAEAKELDEAKQTVNDIRSDLEDLKDMLRDAGKSLDVLESLEDRFNKLVKDNLEEESVLLEAKAQKIKQLQADLAKIKKNQEKTIAGFVLWKILCYSVVILVIYSIVSSILGLQE